MHAYVHAPDVSGADSTSLLADAPSDTSKVAAEILGMEDWAALAASNLGKALLARINGVVFWSLALALSPRPGDEALDSFAPSQRGNQAKPMTPIKRSHPMPSSDELMAQNLASAAERMAELIADTCCQHRGGVYHGYVFAEPVPDMGPNLTSRVVVVLQRVLDRTLGKRGRWAG